MHHQSPGPNIITAAEQAEEASKLDASAKKAEENLFDHMEAIRAYVPNLRARSVERVLFQLALIRDSLDGLDDSKGNKIAFDRHVRAVTRMLYSIGRAVEELTGHAERLDGPIGGERAIEYFMSRDLDPHNKIEDFMSKAEAA
jgi:hypothetical protein